MQTPEVSNMIQPNRKAMFEHLAREEDDLSLKAYRALARTEDPSPYRLAGAARLAGARRQPLVPDRAGWRVIASYDKIHMFDIDLPGGESYRESTNYQPGETAVISDLPWGRIGLTICYDLRFPALYRALAESGASFLTVPSAFTVRTGEAHWHTLLRARAIENGCFVFAAAQAGTHERSAKLRPFPDRRPLGHRARRRRRRRDRRFHGGDRSIQGRDRAQVRALAAARKALQRCRYQIRSRTSARGAGIGMIHYNLRCERGHGFESWFQSSSAYEAQEKRKLVNCPNCGSTRSNAPSWHRRS